MKKVKEYRQFIFTALLILSFVTIGILSIVSIRQIQGHARVVNYVGIVRGATQKLIKEELHNSPDDTLIMRLDSILENLSTGSGDHNLVVLNDDNYLELLDRVRIHWRELKTLIEQVRQGGDEEALYESSQTYFDLVNETVFAAEAYSEARIRYIMGLLIGFNSALVILFITSAVTVIKGIAVARRAKILGKIAYIDPMTQLDNRASCEELIERISATPSGNSMAVVMFDMNNLKMVNDTLGHQSGDTAIIGFSLILKKNTEELGFIGRYGGDEFIAILDDIDFLVVEKYLKMICDEVQEYNVQKTNDLERLSFASGYSIGNLHEKCIEDMIYEADKNMYENKHKMKKGLLN
ncbi:MAG: diguanylate cyclase [Peptococcaceae bacterium]|nr:diguanylate cyclase [Peptococcaceae bacterium]